MLKTLEKRPETEKALSVVNGNGDAQSLTDRTETVYCETHGLVNGFHGHCAECVDEGYRDWVAVQSVKSLIPDWTGITVNGRQVVVAHVHDALEAVQAIGRYKSSDALVLIVWDRLVTALDHGRIGPHWTLPEQDAEEIECARCCQPFRPLMGDEKLCDACALAEGEGLRSR